MKNLKSLSTFAVALGCFVLASTSMAAITDAAYRYGPEGRGIDNKMVDGPTLKVGTYNIGSARISNVDDIAKAIMALDVDVLSLNEVDNKTARSGKVDQAYEIAQRTGMYYAYGPTMDFEGGQYGIAILSKYPIVNQEVVKLPSDDQEPRIVLLAEIDVPQMESSLIYMNTHLDFNENHQLQFKQIRAINDLAVANNSQQTINHFTTKVKILAGDFNDTYNAQTLAELYRYWDLVATDNPYDMRSWPASNPSADLDHIFTNRGQQWEIQDVTVYQGDDLNIKWADTSDHVPVIATLKLIEQ